MASIDNKLNKNTLSLQGRITKKVIGCYHVDIMIMSCKGLDMQGEALDPNEAGAGIKKTIIRQATGMTLSADHSKFGRKAPARLMGFSHVSYLIASKAPGAERIASYKEDDIQLVY